MVQQRQRPVGVTVLAILAFILGILGVISGIGILALGGGYVVLGLITLIIAILELALGYGFWTLKPWAWTLGIALEAISIVLSLIYVFTQRSTIASDIIDILISAIIIYYLTRPQVRQAFGR